MAVTGRAAYAVGGLLAVLVAAVLFTRLPADRGPSGAGQISPAIAEPRPIDAQPMVVRSVHDGDTLWLQARRSGPAVTTTQRVRVRLIGLDAPEVGANLECFGNEATDALRRSVPVGSTVWVTADRDPRDRYDRYLLYLWDDRGSFVNLQLVADGAAEPLKVAPNDRYWPQLQAAGRLAQQQRLGLWGAC